MWEKEGILYCNVVLKCRALPRKREGDGWTNKDVCEELQVTCRF